MIPVMGGGDSVLTCCSYMSWHICESIECVDSGDAALIKELEDEGFFQLDSSAADEDEIDVAEVTSGRTAVMGGHVLALKTFLGDEGDGSDEGEDNDEEEEEKEESIEAVATRERTPSKLPPAVTNTTSAGSTDGPDQKKQKIDSCRSLEK